MFLSQTGDKKRQAASGISRCYKNIQQKAFLAFCIMMYQ